MKYFREPAKFFIGIVLTCAILIVVLVPVYKTAIDTSRDMLSGIITSHMDNGAAGIEQSFDEIRRLAYSLRYARQISILALMDDRALRADNYMHLFHYQQYIKPYALLSVWENDIVVQFSQNTLLLTPSRAGAQGKTMYQNRLFCYEGLAYEDFRALLFEQGHPFLPAMEIHTREKGTRSAITYNQYFSFGMPGAIAISTLLPTDALEEALLAPDIRDFAQLIIVTNDGQALYGARPAEEDAAGYKTFEKRLPNSGLRAFISVPLSVFDAYLEPIAGTVRSSISFAAALALLCALLLCYFLFRPIRPVLEYLHMHPQANQSQNLFRQIHRILETQRAMETQLRQDHGQILSTLGSIALNNALSGKPLTPEERRILEEKPVLSQPFGLVLFQFDDLSPERLHQVSILGRMWFKDHFTACRLVLPNEMIAVLPQSILSQQPMEQLRAAFGAHFGRSGKLGWSSAHYLGSQALMPAFLDAQRYLFTQYHEEALPTGAGEGTLPFDVFIDLIASITGGDEAKNESLFRSLRIWLVRDCPSMEMAAQALGNISQAIGQAARQIGRPQIEERCPVPDTFHLMDALTTLQQQALGLLRDRARELRSDAFHLSGQILSFIDGHLSNPDLCLTMLSDAFNLSESYISQQIKRHTGESYAVYITGRRMDKARELILSTQLSIDEIVPLCGYAHKNTFYKAFKRAHGHPPNALRENARAL